MVIANEPLPTLAPEAVETYGETLLRRLIRLVMLPQNPDVPLGLRRRAVFWAYQDCVLAGLRTKANFVLRSLLGDPAKRPSTAVSFAPELPNPNQCRCGHMGKTHRLASLYVRAGCNSEGCPCTGFASGGTTPTQVVAGPDAHVTESGIPCGCGHLDSQHVPDGSCAYCDCLSFWPVV